MRTGRPKAALMLTDEERRTLEQWTRRPKTAQALARRARLLLACATGQPNYVVAAEFKTTDQTVGRWRRRFVARLLALTLETTPKAATQWNSRDMAKTCGLSKVLSAGSGGPSACSRIGPKRSSFLRVRSLSTRS